MFFYFIPPFLALLSAFYYKRLTFESRELAYVILTSCAIFIYCCVYINGSDWPHYERYYINLTWENMRDTNWEVGFCFTMYLFKSLDIGFFVFLIIAKSFSLITLSNFFKKYSAQFLNDGNFFWALFIFYSGFCMYLYVETIIRFAIALAIVVRSYKYWLNRNAIGYFVTIFVAILFHKSAILMLPFYFCKNIVFSNKILVPFFIAIILLSSPVTLLNFFKLLVGYISPALLVPVTLYTERIVNTDFTLFSVGNSIYMLFLLLCILNRRTIEEQINGHKWFAFCMIYFLISFIAFSAGSVERISLYFMPVFVLIFGTILSSSPKRMFFLAKFFVVIYFMFSMGNKIVEKKSFLPYTNYVISALTGNLLPLEERESFFEME